MEAHSASSESFVIDQAQLESLRVELSMITPEQQREVEEFAEQVVSSFLAKYQQYLPEQHNDDGISRRIVITDNQTLNNFPEVWSKNDFGEIRCVGDYEESYGKFIVVTGEASHYWEQLTPEWQMALVNRHGSEQEAQKYAQEWGMANSIIHEIIHHQQPEYLYAHEIFLEGGATVVEAQLAEELGIKPFPDTLQRPEYEAFLKLQQELGNEVLSVLFGRNESQEAIRSTVNAFTQLYQQVLHERSQPG